LFILNQWWWYQIKEAEYLNFLINNALESADCLPFDHEDMLLHRDCSPPSSPEPISCELDWPVGSGWLPHDRVLKEAAVVEELGKGEEPEEGEICESEGKNASAPRLVSCPAREPL
jgi:hypothetical protein